MQLRPSASWSILLDQAYDRLVSWRVVVARDAGVVNPCIHPDIQGTVAAVTALAALGAVDADRCCTVTHMARRLAATIDAQSRHTEGRPRRAVQSSSAEQGNNGPQYF